MKLNIKTKSDFAFWPTVFSHGWCDLEPFSFDEEKRTLFRIEEIDGKVLKLTVAGNKSSISVDVKGTDELTSSTKRILKKKLSSALNFDWDLQGLYDLISGIPEHKWVSEIKAGRMLRCPDLFEDTVKTICTTNCTWGQTKGMVRRICHAFGEKFSDTEYTFPSATKLAEASDEFLKKEIKLGYRSSYILELSEKTVSGELDLTEWQNNRISTAELKKNIKSIKGVGDYAAENILKLLGRFDFLAIDSWVRKKYAEFHNDGKPVSDKTIAAHYEKFGKWKGLVLWCEMFGDYLRTSGSPPEKL